MSPFALLPLLTLRAPGPTRIADVIYAKAGGTAFTMDVVRPPTPNGAAAVFMVSGGWISDHSMLQSFMPGIEKTFLPGVRKAVEWFKAKLLRSRE